MVVTKLKTTLKAAITIVVLALLGAQSAAASTKQDVFFEAPRDLTASDSTDATRAAAFTKLDALGVKAIRVNLRWYDVAPARDDAGTPAFDATDPSQYSWGAYGTVIDTARQRGWKVLISLSSPVPKWASEAHADNVTRPIPAEFQKFATATARRFGGDNVLWSIWNEPNLPRYLMPQISGGKSLSGRIYRELFIAGRNGIRAAGQTTAPVLFGELAPVGGATDGRQYPLSFLRDALCLSSSNKFDSSCGALQLDGVAMHPYQFSGGKLNKNDVTYRVLDRLVSFLDTAAKAKSINAGVPVYYTEFGIQSYPDKIFGVSPQRQYEIRARAERDAYYTPRVRGFSQYLLTDDTATGGFQTGLLYATGKAKPSYDAFRLVLDVKPTTGKGKGKKLSLWGLVRPAGGPTTIVIERKTGKKFTTFKKVRTNALGAFTATDTYRSSAQYRYRWTSPTVGKLTSPPVRPYAG